MLAAAGCGKDFYHGFQRRPDLFPLLRVLAGLKLDELRVAYPGQRRYSLAAKVEVVPLPELVGAE